MDQSLALRSRMVDELIQAGVLADDPLAAAFRSVPREHFLPGLPLEQVYRDVAIITKVVDGVPVSSSSQPAMMAIMLRQLGLSPGMRVLEIGAGTGYNAAILQELVGPNGQVVTVEIDPEIASWARARLATAGYHQVRVVEADGGEGWPPGAPYDRIKLTVGSAEIAPAWMAQLQLGGRMVVPLWLSGVQVSVGLEKQGDRLVSRSIQPCGFTRIRGELAGPDQMISLDRGISVSLGESPPPVGLLSDLLRQTPRREVVALDAWFDLFFWVSLHCRSTVSIVSPDSSAAGFAGAAFGIADERDGSLCLLVMPRQAGEAELLSYGEAGLAARDGMLTELDHWRRAGQPEATHACLTLLPLSAASEHREAVPGEITIDTRWWRISVSLS